MLLIGLAFICGISLSICSKSVVKCDKKIHEPMLLYDMLKDIENKETIPWWTKVEQCVYTQRIDNCMDYCRWNGIVCDKNLTNIKKMYLAHKGLRGFIHWQYLPKKLKFLHLSNGNIQNINFNDLSGSMLEILYLNNNGMKDIDFNGLSKTNLKCLDLSKNEIKKINFQGIQGSFFGRVRFKFK